ncbi:MAG: helix-turn-helix domain-containing protein, partial [Thiothrix litoralis]|uniref:helix-turn-helix domain-containing protein n=1 Tax=Thiothrix litoralis TaxID=2891210 RepID=UPI003C771BA9
MQRCQAFKYELMPNGETQRHLRRYAGSCRFVYNKALALQQASHEAGEKFIGYNAPISPASSAKAAVTVSVIPTPNK